MNAKLCGCSQGHGFRACPEPSGMDADERALFRLSLLNRVPIQEPEKGKKVCLCWFTP